VHNLANTPQENVKIDVVVKDETIWLTQKAMAILFDTSRENVTMHLKNVFETSELQEFSVCKKFLLTASDGKNYNTQFYNLDASLKDLGKKWFAFSKMKWSPLQYLP